MGIRGSGPMIIKKIKSFVLDLKISGKIARE